MTKQTGRSLRRPVKQCAPPLPAETFPPSCRTTIPDVTKALAYNRYLVGRSALEANLRSTFENYSLEFLQNDVEILSIHGDTATEQILFSVKGTPKKSGSPFLFKGRTMLILVRYDKSPTGWATLREIVQPAPEGQ